MIVADVTFYPIGKGVSVGDAIEKVVNHMEENKSVRCYPNSMATVIEGDNLDILFDIVKDAEKFLENLGFPRIETILRIDNRTDVENSVERKIKHFNK
ncbi:MAG: MTH1187 family thiamine-binding protein [Ferroplasma sp.]|uniref:MTH1187 family thiamine-binding protein n=1 Tax=Ferroplasma sp. TaxID=2591003 RepID=UPI00281554C5|nr:MTH1187 family thiamine-binding protein [Ferroplasma sp.]WMT51555.1 MAG: MTH1187 family thiamine-binding protein [Ferroplasma sp.]